MRRSLAALPLALGLALAARAAVADDFKWDPKHRHAAPKVGDKSSEDVTEVRKMKTKISQGDKPLQDGAEDATTTYKLTKEVVAVEGKTVTEEVVKVVSWKLEKTGNAPDTSLSGHTVRVKGKAGERTTTIEDDKDNKVSEAARSWATSELGKQKSEDEEDAQMAVFFPKDPIGDGAEWKCDLAEVAKGFGDMQYDAAKSSGTGKLSKVRVENGVHMGHFDVTITLATKPKGVEWKEGGLMTITISIDTSLDADAPNTTDGTVKVLVGGKGEVTEDGEKMQIDQHVEQTRSGKTTPIK